MKGEEDAIVSDSLVTQVFEGKDAFVQMLNIVILLVLLMIKSIESLYLLIMTFSFLLVNTMRILGTNYKLFLSAKKVYATNQKYYHYLIDNPDSITQSWNEKKFSDMFGFYKEVFYSDFVRSQLNKEELQISQLYYVNGLVHILASLYKSKLDKKIYRNY